jgi:ureidoacrylate peracid hydrolase
METPSRTDLVELDRKIDPAHTALLLIDIQNDFCSDRGALAGTGADMQPPHAAVDRIESLLPIARAAGVQPIFVRLIGDPTTESGAWIDQRIRRAGSPYRPWATADSFGSAFYQLIPEPGEAVIDKYRYSAFEGTKLGYVLRKSGIRTVVVCGVATNVCVDTAVREAFTRDLMVVLLEDCSAGTSADAHVAALDNLGRFFAQVVHSDDVKRIWTQATPAATAERSLSGV